MSSVLQIATWSVLTAAANLALAAPPGAGGSGAGQSHAAGINKQMVAQAGGEAQQAQWTSKKYSFFYQGFTSQYPCDALRDHVFDALKKLGARPSDLKVNQTGCEVPPDKPSRFAGADIRMSVLEPAKDSSGNNTVAAHWRTVDLKLDDGRNDPGSCELLDAIRKQILPLFTTRNVEARTNCVPHQLSQSDQPTLKVDVLMADRETTKR